MHFPLTQPLPVSTHNSSANITSHGHSILKEAKNVVTPNKIEIVLLRKERRVVMAGQATSSCCLVMSNTGKLLQVVYVGYFYMLRV